MPLSPRLAAIVAALDLRPGLRVLEIGCGPGAMARAMASIVGPRGHVLGIDRSATALTTAKKAGATEVRHGTLAFRRAAVEDFQLGRDEAPFDVAVAVRVGALDGRHPELAARAKERIAAALVSGGRLLVDGGDPLREIDLAPPTPIRKT